MAKISPQVGTVLVYRLSEKDVEHVNRLRAEAIGGRQGHLDRGDGRFQREGAYYREGDEAPLIVTRVNDDVFNGQALLDGNDHLWVIDTRMGDDLRECRLP